ncbi:flavin monoamine oxidase family protein [Paenibacillus ginsengihumi]|uniref:flavin monoamine oxidase family protein n=1 Tax=Paenibacillus ginsengihumi TaxID=431596 RepID=UPI000A00A082|nr:NAD(P)/FAD-dependent oxidoreductase [Paenibacillus ginsengihumi]
MVSSYHSELFNLHPKNLSSKAVLISSRGYKSNKSELTHQASGPLNRIISYLEKISSSQIVVNEPIRQVIETENGYTLRSDTNKYTSRAVIMAIPPTVASRLTFSEGLKGRFHQAFNSYTDGATIKITWVYPKAFWHEYLLEGATKRVKGVIFTDPMGITVVDSSKIHEESRLTMFIGADTAKQLAKENKERRIAFAIKLLENVFGEEAHHYSDMEESVWVDDPYCGGGYSAKIHYTGLYDAADLLRQPYQKVIFASSEISQAFPHFMEGAVRSGQYAARCILEKLNKPTSPEPQ